MPWKYNSYEWDKRNNAFYLRVYIINDEGVFRTLTFKFIEKIPTPKLVEMAREAIRDLNRSERIIEKKERIKKKLERLAERGDLDTLDNYLGDI